MYTLIGTYNSDIVLGPTSVWNENNCTIFLWFWIHNHFHLETVVCPSLQIFYLHFLPAVVEHCDKVRTFINFNNMNVDHNLKYHMQCRECWEHCGYIYFTLTTSNYDTIWNLRMLNLKMLSPHRYYNNMYKGLEMSVT